jgi:hypothetical protein
MNTNNHEFLKRRKRGGLPQKTRMNFNHGCAQIDTDSRRSFRSEPGVNSDYDTER